MLMNYLCMYEAVRDAVGPPEAVVMCAAGYIMAVFWVVNNRRKHPVAEWMYNTARTGRIQPFPKGPDHFDNRVKAITFISTLLFATIALLLFLARAILVY